MKQLSGSDNLFLTQETGNQVAHVGGLAIYDPSTAPGGSVRFKAILDFFTRRLYSNKVFRRRLVRAPLDMDRPYWIDEPSIDVEYHIRHIALPHPGDWRQLMIQVARLHARPLDLSKPAWEAYVIEGLDNIPGVPPGSFAMYTKFHHAAIDGQAGAALIGALHTLTPAADKVSDKPLTAFADREPTTLELLARMVGNRATQAKIAASLLTDIAPMALNMGKKKLGSLLGRGGADAAVTEKKTAGDKTVPHTRFNEALSPHRVIEAMPISLSDCKTIREAFPDVTINDIFLATSGGALHNYLESKGELPAASLRALVPISIRGSSTNADAGNQIGMAIMPLFTQIADPAERLRQVNAGLTKGKKQADAAGKDLPAKIFAVLPAYFADKALRRLLVPTYNVTVSNVRGPSVPLYMAGAKLHTLMPINMLLDHMALSITGFSYDDVLWVCFVADRSAVPDPAHFAQCLRDSFDGLLAAATKQLAVPAAKVTKVTLAAPAPKVKKTATKKKARPAKAT